MEYRDKTKELQKNKSVINTGGVPGRDELKERLDKQEQLHKSMVEQEQAIKFSANQSLKNKQNLKEQKSLQDPLLKTEVLKEEEFEDHENELIKQSPIDMIIEAADRFAPTIGWTNSYALKLVKRQLLDVKEARKNKGGEGGELAYRRALKKLESTCLTYKRIKFKNGKTPKNDRHRKVQAILDNVQSEIKKNSKITIGDVNHQFDSAREKLDNLESEKLRLIKETLTDLNNKLSGRISSKKEQLGLDVYKIKSVYYPQIIDGMQKYLDKHISWSTENERRYLEIHDMIDQFKTEYEWVSKIDEEQIERMVELGAVTYKDIICREYKTETVTQKETEKGNIAVSVVTDSLASTAYKKVEKKGDEYTYDETDLKSYENVIETAKKENRIIAYSDEALMQLREAEIIDKILGIKNRSKESIKYLVKRNVFQGNNALVIDGVKMMDNTGAFGEEELTEKITIPGYKFELSGHPYKSRKSKFKKLSDDLNDRIKKLDPDELVKSLKNSGMQLSDKSLDMLKKRLDAVKKAIDEPTTGDAGYVNYDFVIEKTQTYKTDKLLENVFDNLDEKKEKTVSRSQGMLLESKKTMVTDMPQCCDNKNCFRVIKKDKDGNDGPDKISEIRDYVLAYASLNETAEDKEARKLVGREKRKIYNELRDMYSGAVNLFEGYSEQKEEEIKKENKEYVNSYTGYEGVNIEKRYAKIISDKIAEVKAEIAENLKKIRDAKAKKDPKELEKLLEEMKSNYKFSEAVEIEKDTYKNVVVEADKLTLTEIEGKWIREQKRLARIEKMFAFKGKRTITKNDKLIKEDDVVLYREKKDGEKGVIDINGVEQPYVPQEMVDATDEVLFSHEPCIEDVLQGGLGDCYLIGTIATIVERSPDFIKKMMEEKEDGTVNVRLYDAEGNKVYVNVKKTVPKEYSQGALWVKLIEKAYVVSGLVDGHKKYTESLDRAKEDLKDPNINPGNKRESQRIIDYNTVTNMVTKTADGQAVDTRTARSYNSVEGGEVDLAFKLLTGIQDSDKMEVIDKHLGREDIRQMLKVSKDEVMDTYGEAINDTIRSIEEKQNDPKSKYIFVAGSYPYLFVSGENNDEEANAVRGGIAGPHLYSILGVENVGGKKMIRLRNPWGHGKVHYLKQETTGKEIPVLGDDTDAGTFLMHIEDFGSCFRSVSMIDLNKQP